MVVTHIDEAACKFVCAVLWELECEMPAGQGRPILAFTGPSLPDRKRSQTDLARGQRRCNDGVLRAVLVLLEDGAVFAQHDAAPKAAVQ